MLKLGRNAATNDKFTPEELAVLALDDVKKLITEQIPDAFAPKVKKTTKKVTAKKSPAKAKK